MIYKIVGRKNDGYIAEKVTVDCSQYGESGGLDMCILIGKMMNNCPRFEIYENGKDYIGDFRVKPIYKNYGDN
jgi:hypothetical protein